MSTRRSRVRSRSIVGLYRLETIESLTIDEVKADLDRLGVDPTPSILLAKRLADGNVEDSAAHLLQKLAQADEIDAEIADLEDAPIDRVLTSLPDGMADAAVARTEERLVDADPVGPEQSPVRQKTRPRRRGVTGEAGDDLVPPTKRQRRRAVLGWGGSLVGIAASLLIFIVVRPDVLDQVPWLEMSVPSSQSGSVGETTELIRERPADRPSDNEEAASAPAVAVADEPDRSEADDVPAVVMDDGAADMAPVQAERSEDLPSPATASREAASDEEAAPAPGITALDAPDDPSPGVTDGGTPELSVTAQERAAPAAAKASSGDHETDEPAIAVADEAIAPEPDDVPADVALVEAESTEEPEVGTAASSEPVSDERTTAAETTVVADGPDGSDSADIPSDVLEERVDLAGSINTPDVATRAPASPAIEAGPAAGFAAIEPDRPAFPDQVVNEVKAKARGAIEDGAEAFDDVLGALDRLREEAADQPPKLPSNLTGVFVVDRARVPAELGALEASRRDDRLAAKLAEASLRALGKKVLALIAFERDGERVEAALIGASPVGAGDDDLEGDARAETFELLELSVGG